MTLHAPSLQASLVLLVLIGLGLYVYKKESAQQEGGSLKTEDLTADLTELAKQGKLPTVVGMDATVERLLHVIARRSKNNPLLIGEPGVGKTAAIEGLAQRISAGNVPDSFKNKRVLSLNLGNLLAGTKYRGELEQRLRKLLDSLEAKNREVILFIDEIHMIQQARGSEGSLDIADILKPALSRGDLQIVGATTWREYEEYLKPDGAIDRRFQPVLVEEPSRETAIKILEGVKTSYEQFHGVCIPHHTIEAAVDTSMEFIKDRFLPDKAFDIIDEACAKVSLEAGHAPHAAALGLLHKAAEYANECGGNEAIVTEADVQEIAQQWHAHRTRPQNASA